MFHLLSTVGYYNCLWFWYCCLFLHSVCQCLFQVMGALILDSYVFIIVTYEQTLLSFYSILLCLGTFFYLKTILSKLAIPGLFCISFAWTAFFIPFTFSLCVSLNLKWFSCRQKITWILKSLAIPCILTGKFNPLHLKWLLTGMDLLLPFCCFLPVL